MPESSRACGPSPRSRGSRRRAQRGSRTASPLLRRSGRPVSPESLHLVPPDARWGWCGGANTTRQAWSRAPSCPSTVLGAADVASSALTGRGRSSVRGRGDETFMRSWRSRRTVHLPNDVRAQSQESTGMLKALDIPSNRFVDTLDMFRGGFHTESPRRLPPAGVGGERQEPRLRYGSATIRSWTARVSLMSPINPSTGGSGMAKSPYPQINPALSPGRPSGCASPRRAIRAWACSPRPTPPAHPDQLHLLTRIPPSRPAGEGGDPMAV
jgi:hypothetical protein